MDYEEKIFAEKLGLNIKKYRVVRKLSQEQLAEAVNSSQQHISMIENGHVSMSHYIIFKIADKLGISLDALHHEPI